MKPLGGILYRWITANISNIVERVQWTRPDSIFGLKLTLFIVQDHLPSGEPRFTISEVVYVW